MILSLLKYQKLLTIYLIKNQLIYIYIYFQKENQKR